MGDYGVYRLGQLEQEVARLRAENERLRAALREIAAMRREDLPLADGLPEDNLAAHHARIALEQSTRGE